MSMTEEEFWAALAPSTPAKPIYRLYHDDAGRPLFWTMQNEPGNYIDVDQEIFWRQPKHVRVRDGKLIEIVVTDVKKLIPGDSGTCCDPRDVCIVVDSHHPHIKWSIKENETS
jgi:hypothetical protein